MLNHAAIQPRKCSPDGFEGRSGPLGTRTRTQGCVWQYQRRTCDLALRLIQPAIFLAAFTLAGQFCNKDWSTIAWFKPDWADRQTAKLFFLTMPAAGIFCYMVRVLFTCENALSTAAQIEVDVWNTASAAPFDQPRLEG
jgi:hypothetical protein